LRKITAPNLVDALKRQEIVAGNAKLVDALIKSGELVEYQKGDKLIVEGGEDNDIYLLLSGSVAVVIKGNEINSRKAGQHVGEMAAIEPSQKRSATNVGIREEIRLRSAIIFSIPKVAEADAHQPIASLWTEFHSLPKAQGDVCEFLARGER
jgi:CRP-like cAMP-binding protein